MQPLGVSLGRRDGEDGATALALGQAGEHDRLCGERHGQRGPIDANDSLDLLIAEKAAAESDQGVGLSHER